MIMIILIIHSLCAVAEFDDNTYDHFKGVMRSWPLGFSERIVSKYRSLYYPGSADDLPSW